MFSIQKLEKSLRPLEDVDIAKNYHLTVDNLTGRNTAHPYYRPMEDFVWSAVQAVDALTPIQNGDKFLPTVDSKPFTLSTGDGFIIKSKRVLQSFHDAVLWSTRHSINPYFMDNPVDNLKVNALKSAYISLMGKNVDAASRFLANGRHLSPSVVDDTKVVNLHVKEEVGMFHPKTGQATVIQLISKYMSERGDKKPKFITENITQTLHDDIQFEHEKMERNAELVTKQAIVKASRPNRLDGLLDGAVNMFDEPIADKYEQGIRDYMNQPTVDKWDEISSVIIDGSKTLWGVWIDNDNKAPTSHSGTWPRIPKPMELAAAIAKTLNNDLPSRYSSEMPDDSDADINSNGNSPQ